PLFEWDQPAPLEVKGKAEPVVAFGVERAKAVGMKVRGLRGVQSPLIGRDRELAAGREATARVLAGTGGILFVSGEAGIGKSRLLGELRALLESSPSEAGGEPLWLEGRCVSYGESLPYWPFRDLLREWLGVGT